MPKLGLTMTEGVLAEWKVAPGDSVAAGDTIFVVETDKISNEIEAAEAGVIEAVSVAEGETVGVGRPVATMLVEGVEEPSPQGEQPALSPLQAAQFADPSPAHEVAAPLSEEERSASRHRATPLARRVAQAEGIDLGDVAGTGPRGRITADDVLAAGQGPAVPPRDALPQRDAAVSGKMIPLNSFQKVTARRLMEAKREIPHFYVFAEADVTALLELREQLNAMPAFPRLSISHFILTAMGRALAGRPPLNRVWTEHGLVELPQADVGLAVEGPKGLVAPVLRDLARRTLDEVAIEAARIVDQVRAGRVAMKDLQGGATTLSNVGMFGATGLVPIINPGQSSILGVGRSQGVFRPDAQGAPQLCRVLALTLSCDHRVVDGAEAARFLQTIQNGLEAPAALLRRLPEDSAP